MASFVRQLERDIPPSSLYPRQQCLWHLKSLVYWWHALEGCCLSCPLRDYGEADNICRGNFAADYFAVAFTGSTRGWACYERLEWYLTYNQDEVAHFKPH